MLEVKNYCCAGSCLRNINADQAGIHAPGLLKPKLKPGVARNYHLHICATSIARGQVHEKLCVRSITSRRLDQEGQASCVCHITEMDQADDSSRRLNSTASEGEALAASDSS
jgi:hypothetical protein